MTSNERSAASRRATGGDPVPASTTTVSACAPRAAPSACQRSASAGARASPAHTKDTPGHHRDREVDQPARRGVRQHPVMDARKRWFGEAEHRREVAVEVDQQDRWLDRQSDRGDHHGGATAALGGPTQRQHDDLDAIDDHRRKPDPRPYRRPTRAPTPPPNCLLQTHRLGNLEQTVRGWGRYGARRRCPGTWWAPPPSKRLGQAIPVRRVRFPSTSAKSCLQGTCLTTSLVVAESSNVHFQLLQEASDPAVTPGSRRPRRQ